jgi:hypothetical protein
MWDLLIDILWWYGVVAGAMTLIALMLCGVGASLRSRRIRRDWQRMPERLTGANVRLHKVL